MAKKNNTITLIVTLVVLVGVFFLLQVQNKKKESTLNMDLVKIDTAKVTAVYLYPQAEKGKELVFRKTNKGWRISDGKIDAPVEPGTVKNLLAGVINIKPKQLAAKGEDKWKEFDVTDSTATRLKIMEGDKKTLDLYIGKFTVNRNPNARYGGYNRGITGTSYVRAGDGKEVYAVDGFLAMSFNQGLNGWRDQRFLKLHTYDLGKLSFTYPADSGFVATKDTANHWFIGNQPADSAAMASYISVLSYRRYSVFADGFTPPAQADYQIVMEGKNMSPVVIKAFRDDKYHFVMHSSQNPESYFADKDSLIFKKLFVPRTKLTGKK